MHRVRLKARILVPFVSASLFLFTISLFGIHQEEAEHLDVDFLSNVQGIEKSYQALVQSESANLQSVLEFLIDNAALKEAFRSGDRGQR